MFDEALGWIGDVLDKPGRAARAGLDMLGGGGTDPSELLSFLPFSDTLGTTHQQNAISGTDLFKRHIGSTGSETGDELAGLATSLLTDPTTYLGGFAGRLGGRMLGKGAEAAAAARGPGYATTRSELFQSLPEFGRDKFLTLSNHPGFEKALQEIPEGSKYLGSGAEAVAFRSPGGDVSRMSFSPLGGETRPIDQAVLPATRTADIAGSGGYKNALRVERTPYAQAFGEPASTPIVNMPGVRDAYHGMQQDMATRGLDFFDRHAGNVGMYQGRPVVIDPGAVTTHDAPFASMAARNQPIPAFAGQMAPSVAVQEPDRMTRYLLDLLGGQPEMRKALAAGLSAPNYERRLGRQGMQLGSTLGIPETSQQR